MVSGTMFPAGKSSPHKLLAAVRRQTIRYVHSHGSYQVLKGDKTWPFQIRKLETIDFDRVFNFKNAFVAKELYFIVALIRGLFNK